MFTALLFTVFMLSFGLSLSKDRVTPLTKKESKELAQTCGIVYDTDEGQRKKRSPEMRIKRFDGSPVQTPQPWVALILIPSINIRRNDFSKWIKKGNRRTVPSFRLERQCAGVLVTYRHIVTTAKCLPAIPDRAVVFLGSLRYTDVGTERNMDRFLEFRENIYLEKARILVKDDIEEFDIFEHEKMDLAIVELDRPAKVEPFAVVDPQQRMAQLWQAGLIQLWLGPFHDKTTEYYGSCARPACLSKLPLDGGTKTESTPQNIAGFYHLINYGPTENTDENHTLQSDVLKMLTANMVTYLYTEGRTPTFCGYSLSVPDVTWFDDGAGYYLSAKDASGNTRQCLVAMQHTWIRKRQWGLSRLEERDFPIFLDNITERTASWLLETLKIEPVNLYMNMSEKRK